MLVGADGRGRAGRRGTARWRCPGRRWRRGRLRVAATWRTRPAIGSGSRIGLAAESEADLRCLLAWTWPRVSRPIAAGRLGVEQHEQPGDAVLGFDGVVVQQPASLFPAGLGVDDPGRPAPFDGCEVQAGSASVVVPSGRSSPRSSRWVASGPASHASRSPWRAVARVRSWAVSQSSRTMAARMFRSRGDGPGRGWCQHRRAGRAADGPHARWRSGAAVAARRRRGARR